MKFRMILALACLCLAVAPAGAHVLVYKGVLTSSISSPAQVTVLNVYFIYNEGGRQVGRVSYFTRQGQKRQVTDQMQEIQVTMSPAGGGSGTTVLSRADAAVSTPYNFTNYFRFHSGANRTVQTQSMPVVESASVPRVFSFSEHVATEDSFTKVRGTVTYQTARTIAINNAGKSPEEVINEIKAELTAKGFLEL